MVLFKRRLMGSVLFVFLLLMTGCEEGEETAKKVINDIEDQLEAEATKDNEYLLSVKTGSFNDYQNVKLEEGFNNFFSSPLWKYFKAETGEHVVEFSGYCMYMEQKVKANLQFIVEEDGVFELGAVSFNDVPQNQLNTYGLIAAIFEGENSEPSVDQTRLEEEVNVEDWVTDADQTVIQTTMNGYLENAEYAIIGNLFSSQFYDNATWSINSFGEASFSGNYAGEIIPGEPSFLEIEFGQLSEYDYYIASMFLNGEEVPQENHGIVMDLITTPFQ